MIDVKTIVNRLYIFVHGRISQKMIEEVEVFKNMKKFTI